MFNFLKKIDTPDPEPEHQSVSYIVKNDDEVRVQFNLDPQSQEHIDKFVALLIHIGDPINFIETLKIVYEQLADYPEVGDYIMSQVKDSGVLKHYLPDSDDDGDPHIDPLDVI